jgi:hypothetical protein
VWHLEAEGLLRTQWTTPTEEELRRLDTLVPLEAKRPNVSKDIDFLYTNKNKRIKSSKIRFFSYSIWRQVFLIKKSPIHATSEKVFFCSSASVPITYKNSEIKIYNGKNLLVKNITRYRIGLRCGSLVWFKKMAFLKKSKKK